MYVAHFQYYHGDWESSSGKAINGKVSKVSGANLDEVVDIVTGLPVSDHDHGAFVTCDGPSVISMLCFSHICCRWCSSTGINGIEFGDNGELYINIGRYVLRAFATCCFPLLHQ